MSTESRIVYAEKGDRVRVLFDNTVESETVGITGHYICEQNDQYFVVFPSQYDLTIKERGEYEQIITDNDLLYPKPEDFEDTILE
jgi:hypothetical protein